MKVQLSSGNCDIIASNEVFLFKDSNELTFHIDDDDGSYSRVVMKFMQDQSDERRVNIEPVGDYDLVLSCYNFFNRFDICLKEPIPIGESMGKLVYIHFSTKLHTTKESNVKSVRFTLYREQ